MHSNHDESFIRADLGREPYRRILEEVERGELRLFSAFLKSKRLPPWGERLIFAEQMTAGGFSPELAGYWLAEEPENPDALLMKGIAESYAAWDVRGSGLASEVSEAQWTRFRELSKQAYATFGRASQALPADPSPLSCMLSIVMSAGGTKERGKQIFEQIVRRDPHHLQGHLDYVYLLCEKWLGSHEESYAFARKAAHSAPDGSDLIAVLLRAHMDCRHHHVAFVNDEAAGRRLLESPEIREEAAALFDRTIGSSAYRRRPESFIALNFAACWFGKTKDRERCARSFELMGKEFSGAGWMMFGTPETEIRNTLHWLNSSGASSGKRGSLFSRKKRSRPAAGSALRSAESPPSPAAKRPPKTWGNYLAFLMCMIGFFVAAAHWTHYETPERENYIALNAKVREHGMYTSEGKRGVKSASHRIYLEEQDLFQDPRHFVKSSIPRQFKRQEFSADIEAGDRIQLLLRPEPHRAPFFKQWLGDTTAVYWAVEISAGEKTYLRFEDWKEDRLKSRTFAGYAAPVLLVLAFFSWVSRDGSGRSFGSFLAKSFFKETV